jgi:HD-GYP domain-containing protein (c-di-GMP phosphodiesterase class II)
MRPATPPSNPHDLLSMAIAAVRDMSRFDEPKALMRVAQAHGRRMVGFDRSLAATRRDLKWPQVRLMRSPLIDERLDPFKDADAQPVLEGGLLAELIYAGEPRVIDDLVVEADEPAAAQLAGMRSLAAIPQFDHGEPLDMVFHLAAAPGAFARDRLGEMVLLSSLFGQAVWGSAEKRELVEAEHDIRHQYEIIAGITNTVMDEALNLKDHSEVLERAVAARTAELREAQLDAIYMLAVASEAKDEDTGRHVRRIQKLTTGVARSLGFNERDAESLGHAAILHDVGKIHVPDQILKKPGKLTADETRLMREHTVAGERILGEKPFFAAARRIARSHHENFDGSGYPDAMSGQSIPIEARIVHLVDVYDALISPRVYKQAWAPRAAAEFVAAERGRMFDPEIVRAFEPIATG